MRHIVLTRVESPFGHLYEDLDGNRYEMEKRTYYDKETKRSVGMRDWRLEAPKNIIPKRYVEGENTLTAFEPADAPNRSTLEIRTNLRRCGKVTPGIIFSDELGFRERDVFFDPLEELNYNPSIHRLEEVI